MSGWYRQLSLSAAVLAALFYLAGVTPPSIVFLAIAISGVLLELVPHLVFLLRRQAESESEGTQVSRYDMHRVRYRQVDDVFWMKADDVFTSLNWRDGAKALRRLDATQCDRLPGQSGEWISESGLRELLGKRTDAEARRFLLWCEREVFEARRRVAARCDGAH